MVNRSIADDVSDRIALSILTGAFQPGSKLPSLRDLALQHGIATATMKVALSQLQQAGFIDAHPRLGFVVRDVQNLGALDSLRFVLRNANALPSAATQVVSDLWELLILLYVNVLRELAAAPGDRDLTQLQRALDRFDSLLESEAPNPRDVMIAELSVGRTIVAATGNTVYLALYNSVADLVALIPHVSRASADELSTHHALRLAMQAIRAGDLDERTIDQFVSTLQSFNAGVTERLAALLAENATKKDIAG